MGQDTRLHEIVLELQVFLPGDRWRVFYQDVLLEIIVLIAGATACCFLFFE